MELTQLGSTQYAAPATDAELEQVRAAFAEVLRQAAGEERLPVKARLLARRLFEFGWVTGVRSGHTGAAMADVPLPTSSVAAAVAKLSSAMRDADAPQVGERVSYHGSAVGYHGRYWVTAMTREVDALGRETTRFRLSPRRGGSGSDSLHGVRPTSVTVLPFVEAD